MNCDLVFEILTRGPFPAGQPTDASVELHLRGCYECRQLAEALRPATSLFHEALDDQSCDLPGYHGELPVMTARPSAVAAAVEAAIAEIANENASAGSQSQVEVVVQRKTAWNRSKYASLPMSLALLAGAILIATMVGWGRYDFSGTPSNGMITAGRPSEAHWEKVMAGLPMSCQAPAEHTQEVLASTDRSSLVLLSQCCRCHIQPAGSATSLALADHSVGLCLACHTN